MSLRDLHDKFIVEERLVEAAAKRKLYLTSVVLMLVGSTVFVAVLADVVNHGGLSEIDRPIQEWLQSGQSEWETLLMVVLAVVFGPLFFPIIVLIVTVAWGIRARHAWRPMLLAGGILFAVVSVRLIAEVVGRDRPPVELMMIGADISASFPSGHVAGATEFVLLLAYLVYSRRRNSWSVVIAFAVAVLCIVAMAVSRVYLGYHWPTDVIASVFLALAVLGGVIALDTHRTVRVGDPAEVAAANASNASNAT